VHKLVEWVQGVAVPFLGIPGLFLASFLDSSFLSLPEINDFLMVTSCEAHPARALLYMFATTSGSVAGCAILWWLGRRGGEAFLVKRFGASRVQRTRHVFQRWGVLAIAIPALLPPPMPFKIFVLSAGVFELPFWRFVVTLAISRGLRYGGWCLLGIYYGDDALRMLRAIDPWIAAHKVVLLLGTAVTCPLAAFGLWLWRHRRRAARAVSNDVGGPGA
jgi:membrane protein YqaA with SNARE-associated domain